MIDGWQVAVWCSYRELGNPGFTAGHFFIPLPVPHVVLISDGRF